MSNDKSKLHHLVPAPWNSNPEGERSQTVLPRRVRPKNASRACNECQKRKIKCVGSNPCKNCHENSLYCEINDETDGRRRFALKRKVEDLEQDRHLLLGLVEALRDDDYHTMQLLNLIRSNASLDEIRLAVYNRMERLSMPASASVPVPALMSMLAPSSTSPTPFVSNHTAMPVFQAPESNTNRKIMDIARLTDIPLFELPARPWTGVTSDDAFVSHLISLWFTWDHICGNWIDKNLFTREMKPGDINSPFCSPFLVNTILSLGCLYSSYPEAFINPDVLSSRGLHFYNEAKRHLEEMEGRINLTTVQGLGILFIVTCLMGKDRVGHSYMSQTLISIRGLLARADQFIAQAGSQADEMEHSIGLCVRGLFGFYIHAGLALQVPFTMRPPKRVQLPVHGAADTWTTYPYRNAPVPAHHNCVLNQSFDLHLIVYDVMQFCCPADQEELRQNSRSFPEVHKLIYSFYDRLQAWYHQLPACIEQGQNWTPGVIELHLLKVHPSAPASASSMAQQNCIASALAVRDLINTYRSKWRHPEHVPVEFMQLMTVCLFTLLEDMTSPHSRQAFVDVLVVARATARRFQLARGMLRLVQLTARQQNIELPGETHQIFQDFEREWYQTRGGGKFSSSYPHFVLSLRSIAASSSSNHNHGDKSKELFLGSAELDLFLKKWDDALTIDTDSEM
ncbi:hypothetical protein UA08_07414 [Talaromyces atroroseus]|uniref:Zn(2)-C6 fungal-type domain-containing protein n=1 Tax=Talaromyces atroroseus TaxID=1441469 RepID=A0A225A9G0_TALAT|nr:hypothetical protein UA08_07414 [Talaromyces atroroseus]OKL57382.1 hypothetical protein UA08_07414 [Talaromyces atroroseus]